MKIQKLEARLASCAAGPWHKWPEERPKNWTRCIVEHTYREGEAPFYCVQVIGESTPFVASVRWAEILPPAKP